MNKYSLILIGSLAILAAGCASNSVPEADPDAGTDGANTNARSDVYDGGDLARGGSIDNDSSSQLATVVYFDFDEAGLKPEYIDLLAQHADRLISAGNIEIRLEGHADERGAREYNIGLGERRSQTVRAVLLSNGVPADQLSTVSFGEERPAIEGSSEQSYAMNRRVEINYVD